MMFAGKLLMELFHMLFGDRRDDEGGNYSTSCLFSTGKTSY